MKAALKTCNMKMVSLLVDHGYKVKGNPSYYGPYDRFLGQRNLVAETLLNIWLRMALT